MQPRNHSSSRSRLFIQVLSNCCKLIQGGIEGLGTNQKKGHTLGGKNVLISMTATQPSFEHSNDASIFSDILTDRSTFISARL